MRNLSILAAGLLASAAANAATYDLYIGGASAQTAFWQNDFGATVCNGVGNVVVYTATLNGGSTGAPANVAWRCTAAGSPPAGINVNDVVTVHYNSELGSVSGVAPMVYDTGIARRLFVNPDSLDCSAPVSNASNCDMTAYDNHNETFTSAHGDVLQPMPARTGQTFHQFDLGATDVEPKHWSLSQNWPDSSYAAAFGSVPSSAALTTLAASGTVMNGQVFSVIVNNSGPMAGKSSISSASLRAIFTGQYQNWGEVPEVGGGNTTQIVLCRREHGSGTQVSMSIFITGNECGRSPQQIASIASPGNLGAANINEATSTGKVRTCVTGAAGGIGITSVAVNEASYHTLDIDSVQANTHNAANGFYPFWMESYAYNLSSASGAAAPMAALAAQLITNARKVTALTTAGNIETDAVQGASGTYTGSVRKSNFALPIGGTGNTPATVAKAASVSAALVGLTTKGGDNCKLPFNSNLQ